MKLVYAIGIAVALAGAGVGLAIGIAPSRINDDARMGMQAQETPIAQVSAQANATAPPVTTSSSAAAIALAKHLKSIGAKMYGAYWCPHCHEQLQLFGKKAVAQLPYVECAEGGKNARPALCKAAKIEGYPTWKIKGKTYEGTQDLLDLANVSGYKGARNF
ncbi:MAG: hypothetical protein KME45_03630 [Stenomitos rutilans HA7619-LM2]|jgi:hypothetical protein|nr:hypothetical protein [Stenomitos rutilans HA7619-LM2]